MNSIPDDELLSAYLDGELSDEQRARVEQMLAEQPEARQLLDDLRALSGGFEALPRHRLEADFASRVLRAAERELLAEDSNGAGPAAAPRSSGGSSGGSSSEAAATPARDDSVRPAMRQTSGFDWKRWRRPLAWAGAAMAAGLLLMVMEQGRQGMAPIEQVAHAPKAGAEFRAADESPPATASDDLLPHFKERQRFDVQPPKAALSDETSGISPASGPEARKAGGSFDAAGAPRRAAPGMKAPAEAPAAPLAADRPPNSAPSPLAAWGMRAGEQAKGKLNGRGLSEASGMNLYSLGVERKEGDRIVSEPLDSKALIVWCDVQENVADRPEFREMLTGNGIVWETGTANLESNASEQDDKRANLPADRAKDKEEKLDKAEKLEQQAELAERRLENERTGRERARSNFGRPLAAREAGQGQADGDDLVRQRALDRYQTVAEALNENSSDYVLLEASEEQLKAVLAEFDRHPEMFITVNVEPAPEAPSQQAFYAYNRGRVATDVAKPADTPAPAIRLKSSSGREEKQQLGKKLRAGRAQQVQILPQQLEANVELQTADEANMPAASEEKALEASSKAKASSGKLEKRMTAGVELKARAGGAAVGQKPASGGEEKKTPASTSEGTAPQDYQQALIILRRVPAAAAEPEAKEESKPSPAKEDAKQEK